MRNYGSSSKSKDPAFQKPEGRGTYLLLFVLLLAITYGCDSVGEMPSDAAMKAKFFANQADYTRLLQMSNEDFHVVGITPIGTYLDTDASWPRSNLGFSGQRWNEYRAMFHKLGIDGLSRRGDYPSSVFFFVYGSGGVVASSDKGFVYSAKPLSPIVQSLEQYPPGDGGGRGHAIGFKPLTENWYMYREEY